VRDLVIVSGAPGAGKSTLAAPLARALGFPLLTKDVIKQTLFDCLGQVVGDPLASSRRLGGAAMEMLWRLAADCPAVVIEANFRTRSEHERRRVAELCERPVEVHCSVPVEVAASRFAERARRQDHHPVHVASSTPLDFFEQFAQPFGVGPVLVVDTTSKVDIGDLTTRVRRSLEAAHGTTKGPGQRC
jgi:predicted kinase